MIPAAHWQIDAHGRVLEVLGLREGAAFGGRGGRAVVAFRRRVGVRRRDRCQAGQSNSQCECARRAGYAQSGQQRQSLAFANLVAGVRQRTAGAITVALESVGSAHPSTPYPPRTDTLTAGDWNKAAAANNRVEFAVEASTP